MGLFDKIMETVKDTFKEALENVKGTNTNNQQNQSYAPPANTYAPPAAPPAAPNAQKTENTTKTTQPKVAKTKPTPRPALTNKKVESDGFTLGEMVNGEYSVLGYNGSVEDCNFVIPNNIDGYTITCIDRINFQDFDVDWEEFAEEHGSITIEIKEGIKYIGDNAFACAGLDQKIIIDGLELPNTLEVIGKEAFANSTITELNLPDSVTYIGKSVCECCEELYDVYLSENITEVPGGAFYDCKSLGSVTFSNKIVTIGDSAFDNCEDLEKITLPKSVKHICSDAFANCGALKVEFEVGCKPEIDPDAFDRDAEFIKKTTSGTSKAKAITVGDYRIKPYGKKDEYAITEFIGFDEEVITIPSVLDGKKITVIDKFICLDATKIIISDGIKHIGKEAFKDSKCKSFVFPSTLETIGESAFANSAIEEFILPDSVTEIGKFCCNNCYDLKTVKLSSSLKKIPACAFCKEGNKHNRVDIDALVIPEGITKIDNEAFKNCGIKSLKLPESLLSIGSRAFYGHYLSELNLNKNLKTIEDFAFSAGGFTYSDIDRLNLPKSEEVRLRLKFLDSEDSHIDFLNIPKSVSKIGRDAFSTVKINSIYIESGCAVSLEDACFADIPGLISISIPATTTKLHDHFLWTEREGYLSHSTDLGYEVTAGGNLKFKEMHNYNHVKGVSYRNRLDENLTIYCDPGSVAYEYARKNNFKVARRVER